MPPKVTADFLQTHCLDCHDGDSGEGGFGLDVILGESAHGLPDPKAMHHWVRVFDRVNDGEMPPDDYGEVDAKQKAKFLKRTFQWLDQTQSQQIAREGRVPSRRLTNLQLENTLCDLLSVDIPLRRLMPQEQRTEGFRNIAEAQAMSHYYLQDHLTVVDAALDAAFERAEDRTAGLELEMPPERIANKRKGQRNRDPEMRQDAAVVWACDMSFYGRISNSRLRDAGWYDITLNASAIKLPKDRGLWCTVRSGECVSRAPLMSWIGSFEATETPAEYHFTAWIEADHMLEITVTDSMVEKARFQGGQVGFGEGEPQDVPGLAMHSLSIRRVFPGGEVSDVRQSLFGDLKVRFDKKSKRWELESEAPQADLNRQLKRFADRAFRQPVSAEQLRPYEQALHVALENGVASAQALRQAYRALLCSPRFVYFQEHPGRLDDHAVATRLSYLLTGSMPDAALRKAADRGELRDPQTIMEHTRRLLQGDGLEHFVTDFADQWLDLADIDFTEPDRRRFREFDQVVQHAMLEETRRFLNTMLVENRPARDLVDADFTWLNNRLAEYYDIDCSLEPSQWTLVSLADHPRRGGLMTQGAILKVTANGTNTSPVVRGVWVCDRLLGVPIPDPPENVPAIEPDTRGTTTVREMLEKHRSQVECAACHSRIDPPGFALEHFNAAGQWRDRYRIGNKRSSKEGPEVDSAYQLADGREFDSFMEFRDLAATDHDRVARNFAAKVLTYATGREPTFADRKALDEIVAETEEQQHGVRSLIEAVVTSQPFLNQ
ncbi:DUF1592 domain-containing protein [Roseiconus nitratireducens]|uniref:DUF1592 domain-containing protein n=2 Tax=Roseiconus nitratireducens TaxID=2605748 RepID=A0A5M6D1D7_9BACT|nr:DUF1592 domain-containing protein [Roseiconus nitratireducens]